MEEYGVLTERQNGWYGDAVPFAGIEKGNPTKLHAVMKFDSVEAMQAFGAEEELTETRRQAGAVIESSVMAPISDEFFTNFSEAFMQQ